MFGGESCWSGFRRFSGLFRNSICWRRCVGGSTGRHQSRYIVLLECCSFYETHLDKINCAFGDVDAASRPLWSVLQGGSSNPTPLRNNIFAPIVTVHSFTASQFHLTHTLPSSLQLSAKGTRGHPIIAMAPKTEYVYSMRARHENALHRRANASHPAFLP